MNQSISRRKFLFMSGGALGLLLVGCSEDTKSGFDLNDFREVPCSEVKVASLTQLKVGKPLDFDFPVAGVECFLVKLGASASAGIGPEKDIVAFSYLCTHMGCSLSGAYDHKHKILGPCKCHFTTFSLRQRGAVVFGQATTNLVQINLRLDGNDIYATGLDGVLYGELENCGCKPTEVTT